MAIFSWNVAQGTDVAVVVIILTGLGSDLLHLGSVFLKVDLSSPEVTYTKLFCCVSPEEVPVNDSRIV